MELQPYAQQLAQWRKRRKRILAMIAKGMSLREIAKEFGCSRQRIHQIANGGAKS